MMLKKGTPFYSYSYFPNDRGVDAALVMMHSSIILGEDQHWSLMWNAGHVTALGSYTQARKAKHQASEVFCLSHPYLKNGWSKPRSIHEGP